MWCWLHVVCRGCQRFVSAQLSGLSRSVERLNPGLVLSRCLACDICGPHLPAIARFIGLLAQYFLHTFTTTSAVPTRRRDQHTQHQQVHLLSSGARSSSCSRQCTCNSNNDSCLATMLPPLAGTAFHAVQSLVGAAAAANADHPKI